jgi:hypothetical protein
LSKIPSQLHSITRKKTTEANQLAKALQELKAITHNAEAFGISVRFGRWWWCGLLDRDFAVRYGDRTRCGLQHTPVLRHDLPVRLRLEEEAQTRQQEVLPAGGRYDSMIASYRKIVQEANP